MTNDLAPIKTPTKPRDKITPQAVLGLIQAHVGKESAMHAAELVELLTGKRSTDDLARHLRRQIVVLRDQGWPICAQPEYGYWWPTGPSEMEATCNHHRKRALTSLRQASRIKKIGIPVLAGQLTLAIPGAEMDKAPAPDPGLCSGQLLTAEIPEALDQALREWLKQHPGWDFDRVAKAAMAMFLMQQPGVGRDPGRMYLDAVFKEGRADESNQ